MHHVIFFFYLIGKLFSRSTAAKDGWDATLLNAEANRVRVLLRFLHTGKFKRVKTKRYKPPKKKHNMFAEC